MSYKTSTDRHTRTHLSTLVAVLFLWAIMFGFAQTAEAGYDQSYYYGQSAYYAQSTYYAQSSYYGQSAYYAQSAYGGAASTVESFTTTGTQSWTVPAAVRSVSYLVVAGGGGGGSNIGGGGGGGGVRSGTLSVTPGASLTVTVGAGGTGLPNFTAGTGTAGGNSVFSSITATGGGGGGGYAAGQAGASGGSGGGAGTNGLGAGTGGAGTSGQGYAGGNSYSPGIGGNGSGGGGGGAGGAGTSATASSGGNGGIGVQSTISGSAVYYGGGGAGNGNYQGTAGLGGGGTDSVNGTANRGGGGGTRASGGSGIVILSYTTPTDTITYLTSGTTWTVPSDWNSSNNSIEVIGGGAGGRAGNTNAGDGGGGGAYSKKTNATLTPNSTVTIAVGAGGNAGPSETAGGDTYLCNSTSNCGSIAGSAVVVGAKGGGVGGGGVGGSGGSSASGIGDVKYSGGAGASYSSASGGGGGAAGMYGAGNAGSGSTGGRGDSTNGGVGGSANAGAGTAGTEFDITHGSGGGGGGSNSASNQPGGAGGLYGGGGGGGSGTSAQINAGGVGKQGIIVITYTPVSIGTPGTPTFSSVTASAMRVSWTAATAATSYKVERCTGTGCSSYSEIASGVATLYYDDSGLSASTVYRYRVRATNATGDGSYSTAAEQSTLAPTPSAPGTPSFSNITESAMRVSWSAALTATSYKLERCAGYGCSSFSQIASGVSTTYYDDSGLSASTPYTYRVRGVNASGDGTYSSTESQTTAAALVSGIAITGWAWSDTIGWIDLNCSNLSICGTSNFGLVIDPATGVISGYAWSDNVGWISANSGDLAGCPTGSCAAAISGSSMTGWLRAIAGGTSQSAGWDGFIALSDTDTGDGYSYGVSFVSGAFSGYGWGSTNVGWVDFSLARSTYNTCSVSSAYTCSGPLTIVRTDTAVTCAQTVSNSSCVAPAFCSTGSPVCLSPQPTAQSSGTLTGHLFARPSLLPTDATSTVYWAINNVSNCSVTNSADATVWTGAYSATSSCSSKYATGCTSQPITQQTLFTLSCTSFDSSPYVETATVNVLPAYQEK